MIVIDNLIQVANQIETERGVSKEELCEAIEQALVAACRKNFNEEANLIAKLDIASGEINVFVIKTVVTSVEEGDEDLNISLKDAKVIKKDIKKEDTIELPVAIPEFGRLAAQVAKQVIIQRLREAEKESVFQEFKDKEQQIIMGTVQRVENRNYLINLGRTESILHFREQIPGETLMVKEKVKVYLVGIDKESRGNNLHISRTHPGVLKCLFEQEIPEVFLS